MINRELIHPDGTILIGMMGSSKSTSGLILAGHDRQPFIDTDTLILDRLAYENEGKTIKDLVDAGTFPQIQTEVVTGFESTEPTVIATGGSVPLYPELVEHLAPFGEIIFIEVDPGVLFARIMRNDPERIKALNSKPGGFIEVYKSRMDTYRNVADKILKVTDPKESALAVATRLVELRHA